MPKRSYDIVTKSNALIEASYRLTVNEQRIVLALASKVQPEDENFKEYDFSIREFMILVGIKNKSTYKEIQETTKKLMQKVFEFRVGNVLTQVAWLAGAQYYEGEGKVSLCFAPWLKPFLLQLKSHFTKYRLENVIQLKSVYSVRIYELLKQYESIGQRFFNINDLRYILCFQEQYPLYADFKRKVVMVAQRELMQKTDIYFEFEEIKTSRKVTSIKFVIKKNPAKLNIDEIDMFDENYLETIKSPALQMEDNTIDQQEQIRQRLHGFGFKPARIATIIDKYEPDYINSNLDIAEKAYKIGSVKNLSAFAYSAIKEDYRKTITELESQHDKKYKKIPESAITELVATTTDNTFIDTTKIDPRLLAIWERVKAKTE